jgi:pimeloyl-ACP methyl ester carboxylesterase/DNA-binding winged helix-turn-helix (wHTH) protein
MTTAPGSIYAFGDYELDLRQHELRCAGAIRHIEPQVFDVLAFLLARHDRLVTKEELLDGVWGHRFVAPATLNSRIKFARQAVGDNGTAQRVIKTVHGRGFRVVAKVQEMEPANTLSPADASEQQIRFFRAADGARIAYARSGAGPPLVKPANWLTHLEYDWESPVWRHWLRELSSEHTLIRYDERGNGLSDRNITDFSFDAWVRDLETLVDELGLERFPIFALSQGCAVAIAYAAKHPDRVSRMVLYGGYVRGRLVRASTPQELDEARFVINSMPLGWARENPAFRQFFAAIFLPDGTPEQHRWFSELQRMTTTPENAVRLRHAAGEIDVRDDATRVQAPALVLHATHDAAVPFDEGRAMAALLPNARFVPLESRNHILLADEPAWQRLRAEVRSFLRED